VRSEKFQFSLLNSHLTGRGSGGKMNGKVLIVDDEPIIGNLLEGGLTESGFEAEYFNSAAKALENIGRIRPDIIISDISMPQMDGYELRRRLRQDPETASIPFIFLSARSEISDQIKEGLKAGADDYVCKPFKIENLIEHIRSVTERAAKARTFRSQADFSGELSQTHLNEIMQIVELNHKTGELILFGNSGGEKAGKLFFREGRLVNAQKEKLEGEEAFFSLSDHTEGMFEFHGLAVEAAEQIKADTVNLLLKAGQMREETRQFCAKVPGPDAVLKLHSRQIPPELDKGSDAAAAEMILNLITRGKTVQEIIACGTVSPVRAGSVLSALFDAGIADLHGPEPASERNTRRPKIMPETSGFVHSGAGSAIEKGFLKMLKSFDRGALTGVLEIKDRPAKAAVYFQDGRIIHACHGNHIAKKALYRIFSEKGGTFRFRLQPVSVNRTIDGSLKSLLEEGSKEIESLRRLKPGTYENVVRINPRVLEKTSKIEGRPGLKHILSLVEQNGRIRDIIDASQMTDFQTYRHLFYMARLGILFVESDTAAPAVRIQIVTDSTADLPADILEDRNIIQLPPSGSQDRKNYSDGSTSENFYHSLNFSKTIAASPSEDDFHKLFWQITPDKDIIAIFLSKKISRTYRNAVSAKEKNHSEYLRKRQQTGAGDDCIVEIIDSRSVSLGLGLLVLEAADRADEGWSAVRIRDHIEKLIPTVRVFFAKDTPAYLEQKGQIGKVRAMFRGLMQTRPILGIWEGEVTAVDQARSEKSVRERMSDWIERGLNHPRTPIQVGIMHADVPKWAEQMRSILESRLNCRSILMSRVGPSDGSYCGPGTVAVAYFPVPVSETEK